MIDDPLFEQVVQAVRRAGELFSDRERAGQIKHKAATDYVTAVDVAVQEQLKRELAAITPDVQFMGEEQDNSSVDRSGRVWILDPVDGTTNLIHNFHHSAVSLALAEGGEVTMGLVYEPCAGDLWCARKGQGAFLNGEPISVSNAPTLGDALVSMGTNPGCREEGRRMLARMQALYDRCQDIRRLGAASIELCYLACGRVECYVEMGLKPWDYAAAMLIIQEAGGVVTNDAGQPLGPFDGGGVAASNGKVQDELIALLREVG